MSVRREDYVRWYDHVHVNKYSTPTYVSVWTVQSAGFESDQGCSAHTPTERRPYFVAYTVIEQDVVV